MTKANMDLIEIKTKDIPEGEGGKLDRLLATHLALEQAVARRQLFVHLSAIFAVPVGISSMLSSFQGFRVLALALFGGAVLGTLLSLARELRFLGAFRSLQRELPGHLVTYR